jgi:hypothetical protein
MVNVNVAKAVLKQMTVVAVVGALGLGVCYVVYTYWWVVVLAP